MFSVLKYIGKDDTRGIELVVPPPKQISFSRVSSRDVSKTNSSKPGSAEGWKVLRDSVAFWILRMETGPNALTNFHIPGSSREALQPQRGAFLRT